MADSYFILSVLNIYYNDVEYLQLIIDKSPATRFYCHEDEDSKTYEDDVAESRKRQLAVHNPRQILIYSNKNFNKSLCETKYKARIETFINECHRNWDDITKIVKVEEIIESDKLTIINGHWTITPTEKKSIV